MMLEFTEKFIQKCEEFIKQNPDVAENIEEFFKRCGRLGLYNLKAIFKDCGENHHEIKDNLPNSGKTVRKVYIPDEDYNEVKRFLENKGILRTVISFYYFSALMVILGYWKLPPRI